MYIYLFCIYTKIEISEDLADIWQDDPDVKNVEGLANDYLTGMETRGSLFLVDILFAPNVQKYLNGDLFGLFTEMFLY